MAFSAFPSGVTAIAGLRDGRPHGLAASSFTSVSIDPPLVSVCVAHTSTTWPLLSTMPGLEASVLGEDQGELCRALAAKSDCFGPEGGARRRRTTLVEPVEALARLGVHAETAPQVIVTHAHYDHIGNLAAFPAAEVIMARREFEFWTGPYGRRQQFAWSTEAAEIAHLNEVRRQDRLTPVDAAYTAAPGIEVIPVGGHTPGQVIVLVATEGGQAVLASDAAHYYEEVERDRPFAFVADLEAMYRGFDLLKEITAESGRVLVPGHDPQVMTRFAPLDVADAGLAVRVG
jgi:glyoxylase-like metal-dependent hydrolase (beta-lactamase superfamily II)